MPQRCISIDDTRWATVLRLAPLEASGQRRGHPSHKLFFERAIDAAQLAEQHADTNDVWTWIWDAIQFRADLTHGRAATARESTMTLQERARIEPDRARLAMYGALVEARGDRGRAAAILGASPSQWQAALGHLPGLREAMQRQYPAKKGRHQ